MLLLHTLLILLHSPHLLQPAAPQQEQQNYITHEPLSGYAFLNAIVFTIVNSVSGFSWCSRLKHV